MPVESAIAIITATAALIISVLQQMRHSRCTRIECPCCTLVREIEAEISQEIAEANKVEEALEGRIEK